MTLIQCLGVCGEGIASNTNTLDIVMTRPIIKCSIATSRHLLVIVQAAGPQTVGFGSSIASDAIQDDVPPQPCYGTKYGIGNQYLEIASYPRAGVDSMVAPFDFNWFQAWLVCVLHDFKTGDKVTIQYAISDGAVMTNLRAYAVEFTGIIATPTPFPFVDQFNQLGDDGAGGWIQGRAFDWNRFDAPGSRCFAGSYCASSISGCDGAFVNKAAGGNDQQFFGTNHWTNPSPYGIAMITGADQPALSSFSFDSFPKIHDWYNTGGAKMVHALGAGPIAAAGDNSHFGGCFNATPGYGDPHSSSVAAYVVKAGDGPPPDQPGQCAPMGSPCLDQVRVRAWEAGDA